MVLTSDPNRHSAIFCSFPRSCLLRSFICAEFTTVKWFRLLCTKTFFSFFKLPKQPNGRGLITQSKESRAFRFNAEMTQSLPGSRLCTLPHPSHCAACSKTASLLCWSGCAPHPQVLPNCCFCFGERHTWLGPVGRLVVQVAKIPSSTSCCLAVRGVPVCRQPIKCVKTVSVTVIYICHSQTRGPLKNRFN